MIRYAIHVPIYPIHYNRMCPHIGRYFFAGNRDLGSRIQGSEELLVVGAPPFRHYPYYLLTYYNTKQLKTTKVSEGNTSSVIEDTEFVHRTCMVAH